MYNPHFNNKMPFCSILREVVKEKLFYPVIKEGIRIWVEGVKPNPYKDIDASKLTLQARIDAGTFENHEGVPRKLERAQGSDILEKQIENSKKEFEEKKEIARKKEEQKKYEKIFNDLTEKKEEKKD